jgi:formylmethanofuran dehydrogenase subunit E
VTIKGCKQMTVSVCLAFFLLTGLAGAAMAGEKKYPQSALDLPPITVLQNGQERTVSLCDAYDFHGNVCPGASMGFMALRYGLELLFGAETPVLEDLVVISRSAGGPMDLLDLVMKGDDRSQRTWPPAGMEMGAENFEFQFLRKSTMQSVTVRLQDGLWPADWFELRGKAKAGTITEAEAEKRKQDRRMIVETFPRMPLDELFGVPEVKTFIAWGHIVPGEIDRHIREQRRAQKAEKE